MEFVDIRNESEREARRLMRRSADHHGHITRNRNVMSNRHVFAGTRIPVETALGFLRAGYGRGEILDQYPTLVPADIDAALAFEGQHTA